MSTSLQDAKIQVTIDTKEAERSLRNLDKRVDIDQKKLGRSHIPRP